MIYTGSLRRQSRIQIAAWTPGDSQFAEFLRSIAFEWEGGTPSGAVSEESNSDERVPRGITHCDDVHLPGA